MGFSSVWLRPQHRCAWSTDLSTFLAAVTMLTFNVAKPHSCSLGPGMRAVRLDLAFNFIQRI
jgi:hypothetical protein